MPINRATRTFSLPRAIHRSSRMLTAVTAGVALFAMGCGGDRAQPTVPADADYETLVEWTPPSAHTDPSILVVPTYDGSGQSVHPDLVEFPRGWNGARYWMAMTPYPNDSVKLENPSVLVSDDGYSLAVPPGVVNPLVAPFGGKADYNSDPDLLYDASRGELVLSYRVVKGGKNIIRIITSTNGRSWSEPRDAFSEPSHGAVSQSFVAAARSVQPMAWYVDAGTKGCGAPITRVMMRRATSVGNSLSFASWSEPIATDMAQPGYNIWHLKVRYVPAKREYWALYAAYPTDGRGCGGDDLFLAHSTNGVHWEGFAEPLLRHGDREWSFGALYRGTFLYDEERDELSVWFSAKGGTGAWRMLFAKFQYSALWARLARGSARYDRRPSGERNRLREIWTDAP
jgi:hypothetical protein